VIDAYHPTYGAPVEDFAGSNDEWAQKDRVDRIEHRAIYTSKMVRFGSLNSYAGLVTGLATRREVRAINRRLDKQDAVLKEIHVC